jgi:hypothetical protein
MARLFQLGFAGLASPVLLCTLAWSMEAVETIVVLRILEVDVEAAAIAGIDVAASMLRQLLFFVPAGLGVQELSYVRALEALDVTKVATVAAAFVILKRLRELLFLGIGLGLLVRPPRVRSRQVPVPA